MELSKFIYSLFLPETVSHFSPYFLTINYVKIAEMLVSKILYAKTSQERTGYIIMIGKNTKYPLKFQSITQIDDVLILNIIKHVYSNFFNNEVIDRSILPKIGIYNIYDIIPKKIITIKLEKFNIYGCPLSTDCDIAFITSRQNIEQYQIYKTKSKTDIDYEIVLDFGNVLKNLQKEPSISGKEFDINLISLDSKGNISLCLNGCNSDTQNIIFHTYKYYQSVQKYDMFVSNTCDVDLFDKARGITSYTLKHIEQIIGKEANKSIKTIKKNIFISDSNVQFRFAISILEKLDVSICDKSVLKSIVMKLCQIILLNDDVYAYTKKDIIDCMLINIDSVNALWNLLTRDVHGKISTHQEKQTTFFNIVSMYIDIYKNLIEQQEWTKINIDFTQNPTQLADELIREFISSPLIMNDNFRKLSGDMLEHIDEHFVLDVYGHEHVPVQLMKYIVWIPQRTPEWKQIYKKYNPPATQINHDKYALFRGAITELFVLKYFDFESILGSDIKKVMVGFLHDSLDYQYELEHNITFNMCAPDLLIIKSDKIIPIEIKCLPMKPTTDITIKAYYREIKTAKKQLRYYKQIIDKIYNVKVSTGLLIFVFTENDKISTYWNIIDM